jgi:expansin (peptidoglycan-binding protein)
MRLFVRALGAAVVSSIFVACGSGSSGPAAGSGDPSTGGASGGASHGGTGGHPKSTGGKSSSQGGNAGVPPAGGDAGPLCSGETTHQGQATFYTTADGTGNCSFDASPNDLMIGAMNATDYAGAAACGGCIHLQGPNGAIDIRIVDQCPECPQGNIDLSPEAFDGIAERSAGRVSITWEYVGCPETGPLAYRFKEGSSQYWTGVQVRNHRYRISKFEYQKNGAFVEVPRQDYNYFVDGNGMGPGPYTFRVTDVYGTTVTDSNIPLKVAQVVSGTAQFPVCQ